MCDIADEAADLQEQTLMIALANMPKQQKPFTGKCAWFEEPISAGHYCNAECRDDHETRLRAQQQRAL